MVRLSVNYRKFCGSMKTWNNRLFPWGRKKTVKIWGRLCNILEELLREIVSMIGQSAKVWGTYWLVIQFVHTSHFNLNEESSIVELKPLNNTLKFYQTLEPVLWMNSSSHHIQILLQTSDDCQLKPWTYIEWNNKLYCLVPSTLNL